MKANRSQVMREIAESLRRSAVRSMKRRAPGVPPPVECVIAGEEMYLAADAYDRAADDLYLSHYAAQVA